METYLAREEESVPVSTSATPETFPSPLLPRRLALPDFPWDSLRPYRERAAEHPDGVVDLAVGTPVDPTPEIARTALSAAANAPGYPTAVGASVVRAAIIEWMGRRRGVEGLSEAEVIPTIGSKESVALLPLHLGVGPGDLVLHPRAAYPTYDVGARLVGATPVPVDSDADPTTWDVDDDARVAIVWLNSPGNPDGHVLDAEQLARIVAWARGRGAIVISDECYAELAWESPWDAEPIPSLLDPRVGGAAGRTGLLALYSLSKQSNLAGYRAAFLAGDADLVGAVTEVRKHTGMLVPTPVQAALVAALGDEAHMEVQKEVYRERREVLVEAAFAELGIVVAPGDFYGEAGAGRVRMSLTDTDERVQAAAQRLRSPEAAALFAG